MEVVNLGMYGIILRRCLMFRVKKEKIVYSKEPDNPLAYTDKMNIIYTRFAVMYEMFIFAFPLWKKWISSVLEHVQGEKLLDISFGPGYLFKKYPESMSVNGLDYNKKVVARGKDKYPNVDIVEGNVYAMPYDDESFDTVVNTMSFSGYPDGRAAVSEMMRVLRKDGVLLLMDYAYPEHRNLTGYLLVKTIERSGNIIRDLDELFSNMSLNYEKQVIGGFSSIVLFIIKKEEV